MALSRSHGSLYQHSSSPFVGASRPAEQEERLSSQTTAALQAFARRHHLTMGTLVQGAWAILLGNHFQRDEILVGVTIAGRPPELPGIETMVGLFINTLPLRVPIAHQSQLLEWLQQIQDKVFEIQQYGYSPLAQVQAWSGLPRSLSLFDSILVFENYPNPIALSKPLGRLRISNVRSIEQSTYSLTVAITPGEQLKLKIFYNPACFEEAVICHILSQLGWVLENMVSDPNQRLSTLSRLAQFDRDQVLESRAGMFGDDPLQSSFPRVFEQQVEGAPERVTITQTEKFVPPNTPLEKYLVQLWEKLLKTDQVGIHDSFFELGGDSLTGAICISQLEVALRETIPLTAIFEKPTVYELAKFLEQKHPAGVVQLLGVIVPKRVSEVVSPVSPVSLVPIQPKGSKPPLFCIHPAGGIVFPYYTLALYLGKDQPLFGIQDPSLYNAQSASKSIEEMAARYIEVLKTVQPEGPYHLLGWSVGGVVAFEMAQQLSRQGQTVAILILLDTSAPTPARALQPQLSLSDLLQQSVSWVQAIPDRILGIGSAIMPIASYVRSGLFLLGASVKRSSGPARKKPSIIDLLGWVGLDTWRTQTLKEAEVASTVSQETSLLLIEMPAVRRILELVREHGHIVRRYTAKMYRGRITLFRAAKSGSNEKGDGDPLLGWGELAQDGVEVHFIQSNHVALLVKPYIEILAQELRACIGHRTSSS